MLSLTQLSTRYSMWEQQRQCCRYGCDCEACWRKAWRAGYGKAGGALNTSMHNENTPMGDTQQRNGIQRKLVAYVRTRARENCHLRALKVQQQALTSGTRPDSRSSPAEVCALKHGDARAVCSEVTDTIMRPENRTTMKTTIQRRVNYQQQYSCTKAYTTGNSNSQNCTGNLTTKPLRMFYVCGQ